VRSDKTTIVFLNTCFLSVVYSFCLINSPNRRFSISQKYFVMPARKGKGRRAPARRRNRLGSPWAGGSVLPSMWTTPRVKLHLRFNCRVGTPTNISQTSMVNLLGASITASTTVVALLGSIKINRLRMIDTAGGEIFLAWYGASTGNTISSDLSKSAVGTAFQPSVIDMVPPPNSGAAFWMGTISSNLVLQVSGSANTTWIDLWVICVLGNLTRTFTTSNTPNNNTVYFLPLDGPSATPSFPASGMSPSLS